MRRILASLPLLLLPLLFALLAGGDWGENGGPLTWGAAIAAVLVLVLALGGRAARFIQRGQAVASLLVIGLALPMLALVANAQTVPNTFNDGTPALASEVNENFQALAAAVNAVDCATAGDLVCNPASVNCPAAPPCDTLGSYLQGQTDGSDVSYLIVLCEDAGGTFDTGTSACSVDIAGTAAAVAAAGSAACIQAGGTWAPGTSTCTPSYNCLIGGFCAQAAAELFIGTVNAYVGHTPTTPPALDAGCDAGEGNFSWLDGYFLMNSETLANSELTNLTSNLCVGN